MNKNELDNKKQNKKLPLSIPELVCYVVSLLVGIWGITYIIIGLIGENLPYSDSLYQANINFKSTFGLDFFGWGLIILAIATLFAVIILCAVAKTKDRAYEKEQRRAARLAQLKEARKNNDDSVVDAEFEKK
ncbi:MAG: hypothetical protein MJ227_01510 [Bacilli bacterium]|nr:hypothetical protein [Bacilli bacterium]